MSSLFVCQKYPRSSQEHRTPGWGLLPAVLQGKLRPPPAEGPQLAEQASGWVGTKFGVLVRVQQGPHHQQLLFFVHSVGRAGEAASCWEQARSPKHESMLGCRGEARGAGPAVISLGGGFTVSVATPGARQGGEPGRENRGSALISLLSGPIPLKMDFLMRLLAALKTQIEFWRAGDGSAENNLAGKAWPAPHHHPRDSGTPPPTQHGDHHHPPAHTRQVRASLAKTGRKARRAPHPGMWQERWPRSE